MSSDLRFAVRGLRRSPGFTTVAALTLALGIGATSIIFSVVYGVLLKPLPYQDADRLVAVWETGTDDNGLAKVFAAYADFEDWKDARSFEAIAASTWATPPRVLTGRGRARSVLVVLASDSFFSLLGALPLHGRTFTAADSNGGCTVVLANAFWRSVIGERPDIVGNTLTISNEACLVIGVMPPSFTFFPSATDMWRVFSPATSPPLDTGVFARLEPGVTPAQAQEELRTRHAVAHGNDRHAQALTPVVYELQGEFTWMASRTLRTTLLVLLGSVALVLLVASLSVAGLQTARSLARERELAIRAAMGSGRGRIAAQLLVEAVLLAGLGALAGTGLAIGGIRLLQGSQLVDFPVGATITVNVPVLACAILVAVVCALVVGTAPAWKVSRLNVSDTLKSGSKGASPPDAQRLGKLLIVGQTCLSATLLVAASLLMSSVLRMEDEPLGFRPENLFVAQVTLPLDRYRDDSSRLRFYDTAIERLAAIPGVRNAAATVLVPPIVYAGVGGLVVEGQDRPKTFELDLRVVSPSYFETLGVPLVSGRLFNERDRIGGDRAVIVNRALADRYFPARDPIGQRVRVSEFSPEPGPPLTIVGVVGNEKASSLVDERGWIEPPILFWPMAQHPMTRQALSFVVRADLPNFEASAMNRAIESVDRDVPVGRVESVRTNVARTMAYPRFRAVLLGLFAGFTLVLVVIGTTGLVSQFVSQRTRDLGIRSAIGANKSHIASLVLKQGAIPVVIGLLLGLAGVQVVGRSLESLLYGVSLMDVSTLVVVSFIVLTVVTASLLVPTVRAIRVDPVAALRSE